MKNSTIPPLRSSLSTFGWIYTFRANDGNGYVVLDRSDNVIHRAERFQDAEGWADANREAIDAPLYDPKFQNKMRMSGSYVQWLNENRKANPVIKV